MSTRQTKRVYIPRRVNPDDPDSQTTGADDDSFVEWVSASVQGPVDDRVQRLLSQPRIHQHTKDWYDARQNRITASDWASVLGINPYCTRDQLIQRKCSRFHAAAHSPTASNPSCMWGTLHEDEAAQLYSYVTGIPLVQEDVGLVLHKQYPFIGASPDRV